MSPSEKMKHEAGGGKRTGSQEDQKGTKTNALALSLRTTHDEPLPPLLGMLRDGDVTGEDPLVPCHCHQTFSCWSF